MGVYDPWLSQFGMTGRIMYGITKHCYIINIQALAFVVIEKKHFPL